jgi:hypothetical protein
MQALEFKTRMEEMIELVKSGGGSGDTPTKPQSSPALTPVPTSQVEQTPLSELFKKAEGAWDCSICYVNNQKEAIKCLACETPKPGCEAEVEKQKEEEKAKADSTVPAFSFGFKTQQPQTEEDSQDSAAKVGTGLFSGFSFASPGFGDLAKAAPATSLFGKPTDFKGFGGAGTSVFGGTTPLSAARQRTASQGSEGGGEDDFVPTAEFKPVIPLPPLVETKLGDENENVIFDHR